MFKFIQDIIDKHNMKQMEIEAAERLAFKRYKEYVVVGTLTAITNWTDIGTKTHHSYVLKENGDGHRKVEIISSDKTYAKKHSIYVKYVATWEQGVNFGNIPSFLEIYTNKKAAYFND